MYRKNVATQFICFQMLLTATGAVATGLSPAVRRCIDGTFAAGGGTVTEDGTTGSYKYAMSQADTNGNDISFIFSAATAMPVCVNIVTTACDPTTATNFGITALPAVASGSAGAIIVSGVGTAALSVSSGLVTLAGVTHTGAVIPTVTTVTNQLTAAAIATGVWTDTTAGDFTTALSVGKSVMNGVSLGTGLTVNDITTKTSYALTSGERNSIADAMLDRDMSTGADNGSTTVRTVRQALRFLRNKWSIAAGTLTVCKEDDTTSSWTSTIVTTAGNPVSSSDPAG